MLNKLFFVSIRECVGKKLLRGLFEEKINYDINHRMEFALKNDSVYDIVEVVYAIDQKLMS